MNATFTFEADAGTFMVGQDADRPEVLLLTHPDMPAVVDPCQEFA